MLFQQQYAQSHYKLLVCFLKALSLALFAWSGPTELCADRHKHGDREGSEEDDPLGLFLFLFTSIVNAEREREELIFSSMQ